MSPSRLLDRPPRTLALPDGPVTVTVRESTGAKTSRILIGAQRPLEIIVPAGTGDEQIDRMLHARSGWIADKQQQVAAQREWPARLGLERPGAVWLAGQPHPIITRSARRATAALAETGLLVVGSDAASRMAAVERWYRRTARERMLAVADEQADRLGLSFVSLAVRDQKTRWGSCSRLGNLSFSWRLVIAPAEVLKYVVVHELCHLAVPNHSKAFWRRLEAAHPGWQRPAAWLREHGAELRAYTVPVR